MNPSAAKTWVRESTFGMNRNYTCLLHWKQFYPQIYLIWDLRPPQVQWPFHQEKFTSEIYTGVTAFQNSFCVTSLDKQAFVDMLVNQLIIVEFRADHKVFSARASFDLSACDAEGFIFKITFSTVEIWKCQNQTPPDLVLRFPLILTLSGFDAVLAQDQALFCFSPHSTRDEAGVRTPPGQSSPADQRDIPLHMTSR